MNAPTPMPTLRRVAALVVVALAALLGAAPMARAGALSDYLENKLIDHLFRATAYTAPGTWYVALFTSSCSDSAGGTEVSGGSYARASLASGTGWANTQDSGTGASTGTGGTTKNVGAINFATPSAGWGTVTHWGLYDASSSGNLLVCSALTVSKTINNGDTVSFAAGALTVQVDN